MVINQWNITLFVQQKIWMQRARHDFISGKPDVSDSTWRWQRSALAQRRGVHHFVNFVVYYFGLFGMLKQTALSLYICLTGLLFMQSGCTYQKFRAPARLALTLATCVPRESPNEPHSGPPLTTKPGPAKQTASERGTEQSHQSNEQGFGAQTRSGTVQNTQCGYTFRK